MERVCSRPLLLSMRPAPPIANKTSQGHDMRGSTPQARSWQALAAWESVGVSFPSEHRGSTNSDTGNMGIYPGTGVFWHDHDHAMRDLSLVTAAPE